MRFVFDVVMGIIGVIPGGSAGVQAAYNALDSTAIEIMSYVGLVEAWNMLVGGLGSLYIWYFSRKIMIKLITQLACRTLVKL
jgi:hypothetical protein